VPGSWSRKRSGAADLCRRSAPAPRARAGGFTLIELMIVMSLIVILASIGLAVYTNSVTRAKESVLKEDLFRMRDAIDQYYSDKGKYPSSLQDLVSDKYLRSIPVDPFTNSTDTWREVPAEPDPTNPTAQSGVYDVKSGSELKALDGTNYSDWD
jgi:general secretion pathway protein G